MTAPVKLIGVGEQIDDLESFNIHHFVNAFFSKDSNDTEENET